MNFRSLEDFSNVTRVGVSVIRGDGRMCFATPEFENCRDALSYLETLLDEAGQHLTAMIQGGYESYRFGGRYIFCCPSGLVFFASPIILSGRHEMSVVGGPALMADYDDFIENDIETKISVPDRQTLRDMLSRIPVNSAKRINALSAQLFVNARHLSDAKAEFTQEIKTLSGLQDFHPYVWRQSGSDNYYAVQGQKLVKALLEHDEYPARALLNNILGHVMFHSSKDIKSLRDDVAEFTSVLYNAAMNHRGADIKYIFGSGETWAGEIANLETIEDVVDWLNSLLNRFKECVFKQPAKYSEIGHKVILYMKNNYQNKITVEDIAETFYFNTSYLGKIIKLMTGSTPRDYLNRLRVNEGKNLMKNGEYRINEIGEMVGFSDASYFSKVFKKIEGVTPYQYKARLKELRRSDESASMSRANGMTA
ncbi:MAG: AraC family transcriptional regulator [Synergistaceae bacterium]|jgi:AraC-like DNA-binding protein/ligand-binding sensor protein|nr:AraC family transcriptional regulator [Synergistaceae bacterium]